jgi:predicted transcriptional regulator
LCCVALQEGPAISTTTLRLPDEVKARIERLAAAQGKSAHALMADALDETTVAMERRLASEVEAARRFAEYRRTGEYDTLEDMRTYLLARARGETAPEPPLRRDPEIARAKRRS